MSSTETDGSDFFADLDSDQGDDGAKATAADRGKVKLCSDCGVEPASVGRFGRQCPDCRDKAQAKRDAERVLRGGSSRGATRSGGKMQRDLSKAHLGASLTVVGLTNPQVLAYKPAVDLLEKQSNDWASTVVALAEQDPRIARVIEGALKAGVWAAFASQTAASLVTVGAMTGRLQVPYAAVAFLAPELMTVMPPAAPAQPGTNGGDPVGNQAG